MPDRDSIVRFIRWEAGERYAYAHDIAEAFERLAELIERREDSVMVEPTAQYEPTDLTKCIP